MTEEKNSVVTENKECNCPVCRILKSDCTKKFFAVVLASFIGCSLAILAFAPKKHHQPPRHRIPHVRVIDRPLPPPVMYKHFERQVRPEFRGECPCRKMAHFNADGPRHPEFKKARCNGKYEKRYDGKFNGKEFRTNKTLTPTPVKKNN